MPLLENNLYRFGDFQLNTTEKLLVYQNAKISLTPKMFEILNLFLKNGGKLISKEELMDKIWNEKFVEESNLTFTIRQLRKVLNDDFRKPKFIETVAKRGYRFIAEVETFSENTFDSAEENLNSIAVLPFVNLSDDVENEYFCDGLAEELLNALAKIKQLKVAARTSSFSFKNKNINISEIGKILNVKTILEGSVRKSENKLRITAQLINTEDGFHLWSERFDRELDNIFDVQDEITNSIVDVLKVNLLGKNKSELFKQYTNNIEAYEFYLKGLYHYNKYTFQDLQKAIDYFDQAIEKEPNYVSAFVGKGYCYAVLWYYSYLSAKETLPFWKISAKKALQIDPNSAEAHLSQGGIYFVGDWDWQAAEDEYVKAIELSPNFAEVRWRYGLLLTTVKRFDEAFVQAEKAVELDPLSLVVSLYAAYIYLAAERFDKVAEIINKMNQLTLNFYGTYHILGRLCLAESKYEEAIIAFQKSLALGGGKIDLSGLGTAFALIGKREDALQIIKQLLKTKETEYVPAFNLARIYFGLGENDLGFEWLEKSINEHNAELAFLNTSIKLGEFRQNDFRKDSRFIKLRKKIGLPTAEFI